MSLSQWAAVMGLHPWHVHQLANSLIPLSSKCSTLTYEYTWQNADRAGRHEIRAAIERAEQLCNQYTRLWPTPRFVEATVPYPQLGDRRFLRLNDVGGDGRWLSVQLPDAELLALGPATDTGASTVALTYTDEDGDGLFETATGTATVPSGTQASEVVVRFLAADCGPLATPPEIVPRSVSVVGTTATVVLDTLDLVRPVRLTGAAVQTLDPGNGGPPGAQVCAPSVEVLRRRADPTGTSVATAAVVLTWETRPWPTWAWCCADPSNPHAADPAATAQTIARGIIRDARNGVVAFGEAVYDSTTGTWSAVDWGRCRPPDRVTVRYQAGITTDGTRVAEPWAQVVARLAAAEVARGVCACDGANHALYEWQKDLSQTGATDDLYQAPDDVTNPLGARRGQIYAWRHFSQQQRLVGVYAG